MARWAAQTKPKKISGQALAHQPNYAPALGNLADILADRGHVDDALLLYDRALKLDSQTPNCA